MPMSALRPPLIIFHSINGVQHCDDGFGAAFAAFLALSKGAVSYNDMPEFYPGIYGVDPPLDIMEGRFVYLLDFSYKRPEMRKIMEIATKLFVLDHHKTAKAELEDLGSEFPKDVYGMDSDGYYKNAPYINFDMNHSGAMLAWNHFHPGLDAPDLIKYIEDADLARYALLDTKLVIAALRAYPQRFEVWQELVNTPIEKLIEAGRYIRQYIENKIQELLPNVRHMLIAGYDVPVIGCPKFIGAELANALVKKFNTPFAAVYEDTDTQRVFSLRSHGDFDVSEIARKYGGGGHRNAAGFQVPLT